MERFNYEINMRVLVPFRRLINYMERRGLLDKELLLGHELKVFYSSLHMSPHAHQRATKSIIVFLCDC